jgi:DNA (cytosine-5)-methyltransferase 1
MKRKLKEQLTLFPNGTSEKSAPAGSFGMFCQALDVDLTPGWIDRFGRAIHKWAKASVQCPIRTLSLFSGAGGLDIGFHDAGFKIEAMVEIEERFAATLSANSGKGNYFGEVVILNQDIRHYHPPENFQVDFIIGGPPCQPFSAAARRAAGVKGTTDKQGKLFEEYVRLLRVLKPKGFLFENVYGITGAEGGTAWARIREAFQRAGYQISFRILDAADYGVPQHRERMFIVGTQERHYKFPFPIFGPDSPEKRGHITAGDALKGVCDFDKEQLSTVGGRYGHLLAEIPPGLNYSFFTAKMGHPSPLFAWRSKFSDFLYKADPMAPTRTLKAQVGQYSGPFHWSNRPFTIAEFKRLQTFPDMYQIAGGRQAAIHQIGNSVPPQLARILALTILNQVFDIDLPSHLPLMEHYTPLSFRRRKQALTDSYRERAKAALDNGKRHRTGPMITSRKYAAHLSNNFTLHSPANGDATLTVKFSPKKLEWAFQVAPITHKLGKVFSIEITPALGVSWGIPTPKVTLTGAVLSRDVFTALWKAFDSELVRLNLKADLVQLSGYYQYQPAFTCQMNFAPRRRIAKEWEVVKLTIEGVGVGRIIAYGDMANLWGVQPDSILEYAQWLRTLGYEVRNNNTNPQIPKNHLLVPYVFPTLTSMSVQLRKSLVTDNA